MLIRPVKKHISFTTTGPPEISFPAPGGNYSWKCIRVSNYSPWLATLQNTSDVWNNPTQSVVPFQQNIYNYEAKTSNTIDVTFSEITILTLNTVGQFYMIIEYGSDYNAFPGAYPSNLGGLLRVQA